MRVQYLCNADSSSCKSNGDRGARAYRLWHSSGIASLAAPQRLCLLLLSVLLMIVVISPVTVGFLREVVQVSNAVLADVIATVVSVMRSL